MPTLYVTEPGAVVRKDGGSFTVTVDIRDEGGTGRRANRNRLLEVEPHRLELIALVGRVHMTGDATHLCLRQGVAVSWFTRGGDFIGRLVPELSRTADLRLEQFRAVDNEETSVPMCQAFVAAKLRNCAALLVAIRSNRSKQPLLGKTIADLNAMAASVHGFRDRSRLLGLEGDATRRYFKGLGIGFRNDIRFSTRARRPPPDPANALMSFTYVLLANTMASLLESRGLDPYLGFMHVVRSGRPSLALDMIEELRGAVADRFVLRVCNRRQLKPAHFEPDTKRGGVRLTRQGLKLFFRAWETFLASPLPGIEGDISADQILHRQVDRLAAHLRGKSRYEPLQLKNMK